MRIAFHATMNDNRNERDADSSTNKRFYCGKKVLLPQHAK